MKEVFRDNGRTTDRGADWFGGDRRLEDAFPAVALSADHSLAPYLGYEQNDAMALGCAFEPETFDLTIDHYNVWRLAAVVADDGWNTPRDLFPVTLRFEGVREFRVVLQTQVGVYRLLRSSLAGLSSALHDVIGLKCVGIDPESFRFHLRLNSRRSYPWTKGEEWAGEIDILIDCARASATENLRRNWIDAIGDRHLDLFDRLLIQSDVQSWSVDDFERFFSES